MSKYFTKLVLVVIANLFTIEAWAEDLQLYGITSSGYLINITNVQNGGAHFPIVRTLEIPGNIFSLVYRDGHFYSGAQRITTPTPYGRLIKFGMVKGDEISTTLSVYNPLAFAKRTNGDIFISFSSSATHKMAPKIGKINLLDGSIDPNTIQTSSVSLVYLIHGLTFDSSDNLLGMAGTYYNSSPFLLSYFNFNLSNGNLTPSCFGGPCWYQNATSPNPVLDMADIEYHPSTGELFGITFDGEFYKINLNQNPYSVSLNFIGQVPGIIDFTGLAFAPRQESDGGYKVINDGQDVIVVPF